MTCIASTNCKFLWLKPQLMHLIGQKCLANAVWLGAMREKFRERSFDLEKIMSEADRDRDTTGIWSHIGERRLTLDQGNNAEPGSYSEREERGSDFVSGLWFESRRNFDFSVAFFFLVMVFSLRMD